MKSGGKVKSQKVKSLKLETCYKKPSDQKSKRVTTEAKAKQNDRRPSQKLKGQEHYKVDEVNPKLKKARI